MRLIAAPIARQTILGNNKDRARKRAPGEARWGRRKKALPVLGHPLRSWEGAKLRKIRGLFTGVQRPGVAAHEILAGPPREFKSPAKGSLQHRGRVCALVSRRGPARPAGLRSAIDDERAPSSVRRRRDPALRCRPVCRLDERDFLRPVAGPGTNVPEKVPISANCSAEKLPDSRTTFIGNWRPGAPCWPISAARGGHGVNSRRYFPVRPAAPGRNRGSPDCAS